MRAVVYFSSQIPASRNIAEYLMENYFVEGRYENAILQDVDTEKIIYELPKTMYDYIIVLSPHKSKTNFPTLCVHTPGNWDSAEFGGEPRTLNIAFGTKMQSILKMLGRLNELGWSVSYECDHHGPLVEKPIMFVEIGSGEIEWNNKKAASIVGEAVIKAIEEDGVKEGFFGVGGGHYAPLFTKLSLEKDFVFCHMLPKYYIQTLDNDTFSQALEKNVEKVENVLIDNNGTNNEQKKIVKKFCEAYGVEMVTFD